MSKTSTRVMFSAIFIAGLMMASLLSALAGNEKGPNDRGASQALETNVKEALREHTYVKIEVRGEDVILRGNVHTRNEKNIVESQLRGVPGVKYVRDEIVIGQSAIDAIEQRADTATTTTVKANILSAKGLGSLAIHVKTEYGVVTLSGKVKKANQIKLAEKVALRTEGVKEVVNELSVEH